MAEPKKREVLFLGEILVKNGWISWTSLEEALKEQKASGRILGEILVEKGYVSKRDLFRALAIQHDKAFVEFEKLKIAPDIIQYIPKSIAYEHKVMPLVIQENKLLVAISNPMDVWAESDLRHVAPKFEVLVVLATPDDIDRAIEKYYGPRAA